MSNKKIDEMMGNIVMSDDLKNRIRKQTTGKGTVVKFRKRSLKSVVLVASLCVAMLGTMTVVAAANIDKIENYFTRIFNFDAETQQKLENEGFVQDMDVNSSEGDEISVNHNGITVTLKETIADKRSILALIYVKSENGMELGDYCSFSNLYGSGDVGSLESYDEEKASKYKKWFLVDIDNTMEDGFKEGDTIEIILQDLVTYDFDGEKLCKMEEDNTFVLNNEKYRIVMVSSSDELNDRVIINGLDGFDYYIESVSDGEAYNGHEYEFYIEGDEEEAYLYVDGYDVLLSEGEWKLSWELTANESNLVFAVNEEIEANGYRYYVEDIQLSPFSIDIDFYERALAIDEEYIWENAVLDEGDWIFIEQQESEGYTVEAPYIQLNVQIVMKDGSVKELSTRGDSRTGHDEEWYEFGQIGEVLELENIEKIIVEGHEYLPVSVGA